MSWNLRRAAWIALPALLVGTIGLVALPRAMAWHRHHVDSVEELSEHFDDGLDYMLHKVDATDAQHKQAEAIVARRSPELYSVLTDGREVRQQLKQALLADAVDPTRVAAVQTRLDALTKRASDIGLGTLTEVAQVLTPAQRKQLSERLARFER